MIQFLNSLLKKRIVKSSRKHFSQRITRQERMRNMFVLANSLSRFEGLIKTRRICNEGSNTSSFITVHGLSLAIKP